MSGRDSKSEYLLNDRQSGKPPDFNILEPQKWLSVVLSHSECMLTQNRHHLPRGEAAALERGFRVLA